MKSKIVRIISLFTCTAIIAGGTAYAFASNLNKEINDTAAYEEQKQKEAASERDFFKDETVYVLANADGTVEKIIVSDWIKNKLSNDKIEDVTELENAENIKSDAGFTLGSDNSRVWDAHGNDIYYQGTIEKELPVTISVTYKLDGKTVSPKELIGKSGKVTIRFDYQNKQYETLKINGKDEKIYVPFVMLTGMLLDNDTFTNVEVSNGKIINDGDRTAVIGFALPGMQENLALDKEKLDIPSYVEITADASNFSFGMTVTMATNSLFSKIDEEKIDSISDLTSSIDDLNNAMTQLLDGSSALYGGLSTLLDKSSELVKGIDELADGATKLKMGAYSLDEGAKKLSDGVADLSSGLNTLSANNDKLNGGAKTVFETLLSTARTQLVAAGLSVPELTIDNYASVLNEVIASLDETNLYKQAQQQVTAEVQKKRDYIKSQVEAAVLAEVEEQVTNVVREQVLSQVMAAVKDEVKAEVKASVGENVKAQVIHAATGKDMASYEAAVAAGIIDSSTQNAINEAIEEKMASDEIASLIESNIEAQMQSEKVLAVISQKTDEQMETEQVKNIIKANTQAKMAEKDIQALIEENTELQIQKVISENMASDEVQAKLSAASEGAKSVISLKASLDSYNTFYLGLMDYTAAVAKAASGASELKNGANELKNGTGTLYNGVSSLYDGILTMKNGAPALIDGITQLKDGAMQLSDGLAQLNEEGIQKLISKVDNAKLLIDRLKAVVTVSKNYRSFAGISDKADGNVKFIYRTDEIK